MALAGLLTISPVKAWLVLYYFMHLGSEGPLLKMVFLATLLTLLTFFVLLFSDLAFR
jgi:cytochrome c oxidase subunit 4